MDIVRIEKLDVRVECGFSSHEIGKLQELKISVELTTCVKKAAMEDDVNYGINLRTLAKIILEQIESSKYLLIETIANHTAFICLTFDEKNIFSAKVTVGKPGAIRFSEQSSVTITRKLEDFPVRDAVISIGSNITPDKNVLCALEKIGREVGNIVKISKFYITDSISQEGSIDTTQEKFLNAACLVRTKMDKTILKKKLFNIESSLGRVRDPKNKFAARQIDLDVVFHGDLDRQLEDNYLDHDEIKKYCHVALPLNDIIPQFEHEKLGGTIESIARILTGKDDPSTFCQTRTL